MVVYCRPNGLDHNRIGYTVSSKLGHAVVRNRIRRRLREIYRLNSEKIISGMDIVVVARHKSVNAPYEKLEKAFISCCRDLDIIL